MDAIKIMSELKKVFDIKIKQFRLPNQYSYGGYYGGRTESKPYKEIMARYKQEIKVRELDAMSNKEYRDSEKEVL